jgi:hypothetical protein
MGARTDRPRLSLNTMYASLAGAFVGALLLAVAVALGGQDGRLADGFLWGLYMLAFASVSGVVGFVFGVPRVRQDFRPEESERYESNSNLEQISDWLTKLLVGAGLVQLVRIPGALRGLGDYLGGGFAIANGEAYAVSAVVFGVGLGFAAGYLWTRLKFRMLLAVAPGRAAPDPVGRRQPEQQPEHRAGPGRPRHPGGDDAEHGGGPGAARERVVRTHHLGPRADGGR